MLLGTKSSRNLPDAQINLREKLAIWLMIQAHVEVMRRTSKEFKVLPKRWVVEKI